MNFVKADLACSLLALFVIDPTGTSNEEAPDLTGVTDLIDVTPAEQCVRLLKSGFLVIPGVS